MVWNIRAKLVTLVAVAALATALLAGMAFAMLQQVSKAIEHTANLSSAIRLQGDADMMHDAIYGNVLAGMLASMDRDAAAHAEASKSFAENAARFRKDLSGLAGIEVGAETLTKLRAVKPALDAYIGSAEEFFRGGIGAADARAVLAKATRSYEELADPMEKLSDSIEGDIDAATAALAERQSVANIALLIAALAGIGVIAVAGWSIGRAISAPLALAVQAVQTVAAGDLTQDLPDGRRDEIGELLHALNAMRESLGGMFVIFQAKAGDLDDASHSLVSAAARVTEGSAQQRDASASIAASLEQMNGSIESVAESMGTSRELAQRAGDASASGTQAIGRLITDMSRIESSVKMSAGDIARLGEESRNIGAVVSVIKEIADQTNLLALNAAIEAARAGEQGRGFAVVADEVRKLAERTANSTEQIGAMIERIVGQVSTTVKGVQEGVSMVETGMRSAQDANAVLEEITRGVQDVMANVIQAADAMREQASAVQHVSGSAERITAMSEQNAKVSEETEQSARALSSISETLRVSAATFKVKDSLPPRSLSEMVASSRAQSQESADISLF